MDKLSLFITSIFSYFANLRVIDQVNVEGVIINAIKTRRNTTNCKHKSLYWLLACCKHIRQDFDLSEKNMKQYPRQLIIPAQGCLNLVTILE